MSNQIGTTDIRLSDEESLLIAQFLVELGRTLILVPQLIHDLVSETD